VKLTDAGIRALKPARKTDAVYDDELRGFGCSSWVSNRASSLFDQRSPCSTTRLCRI
jgi:hypothetical protein